MADIEINEDPGDDESGDGLAEHDASMAAGAAEVHQENAAEAAQEAEAAAETAVAAAVANSESIGAAESAALRAEDSAAAAATGAEAVAQAISAQTAVLESLLSKLETPPAQDSGPAEKTPVKKTTDRAPAESKKRRGGWYYGK
jgi:hypothetical protein